MKDLLEFVLASGTNFVGTIVIIVIILLFADNMVENICNAWKRKDKQ